MLNESAEGQLRHYTDREMLPSRPYVTDMYLDESRLKLTKHENGAGHGWVDLPRVSDIEAELCFGQADEELP